MKIDKRLPKTPGALADKLLALRTARLKLMAEVKKISEIERDGTDALVAMLKGQNATSIAGKHAGFSFSKVPVPKINDWDLFYKYVKRHSAFELLQRRVTTSAFRERWEAGTSIPGVEAISIEVPSLRSKSRSTR
jgi:hypothetical protein